MSCTPLDSSIKIVVAIAGIATFAGASASEAQIIGMPAPQPTPYHSPALMLSEPADGGSVPVDKPVVVFRFTQGEATDPIDALSFVIAIDGVNRTSQFKLTNGEAWGQIDDPNSRVANSHDLRARVCSERGVCTGIHATVSTTVTDPATLASNTPTASANKATVAQKARSAIQVVGKVLQAATVLSHP